MSDDFEYALAEIIEQIAFDQEKDMDKWINFIKAILKDIGFTYSIADKIEFLTEPFITYHLDDLDSPLIKAVCYNGSFNNHKPKIQEFNGDLDGISFRPVSIDDQAGVDIHVKYHFDSFFKHRLELGPFTLIEFLKEFGVDNPDKQLIEKWKFMSL